MREQFECSENQTAANGSDNQAATKGTECQFSLPPDLFDDWSTPNQPKRGFAYQEDASARLPLVEITDTFDRNLARLDSDRNGYVSIDEINRAIMDHSYTGKDALMLAALKAGFDGFRNLHSSIEYHQFDYLTSPVEVNPNGMTPEDMAVFDKRVNRPMHEYDDGIWNIVEPVIETTESAVENWNVTNLDLYGGLPPEESIVPDAIRQGQFMGDCFLLSAIGSVAAVSPETIENMIVDNGIDPGTGFHTYTVTFPGARYTPVSVTAPTQAELLMSARGGYSAAESGTRQPLSYGTWPIILEKAAGRLYYEHFAYGGVQGALFGSEVDADGAMGGSMSSAGLKLMTGGGVDSDSNWCTTYATIHNKLTAAFNESRPVTAYIEGYENLGRQEGNLTEGHEYSVIAYDSQRRVITIRNPFGREDQGIPRAEPGITRLENGAFEMTLEMFNKYFNGLVYAQERLPQDSINGE